MTSKNKVKPPSVPKAVPKPGAKAPDLKPPSVPKGTPKPEAKATGLKGSVNKAVAWAKKNPALAALLIGGVVLLAIVLMRKGTGITAARADSGDSGDDVMDELGGLGGLGLDSYQEPLWSDFIFPEIPLLEEPSYSSWWYPQEEEIAQSSTFYPEDNLDREHYLERAHELEALAGETKDPYFRGLIADMARLTGLGSLTEEDWETEERLRREWEERQNGEKPLSTSRGTQATTQPAAWSGVQWIIDRMKNILTPRTVAPSTIDQRRYTILRAPASSTPTTQVDKTGGKSDRWSRKQSNVSLIEQLTTATTSHVGGLQEH